MSASSSEGTDRSGSGRPKRLRPSGGYRSTASFQTTTLIYDATYWFCEKFLDPRSRTVDQMVQAARSGRQNIAEGSRAAATSSNTELRLLNVARSSLEELLLDFEDYLRHRRLAQWAADSPEARAVRAVARRSRDQSDESDPPDPAPRCPQCGKLMALRTARTGQHAGGQFWGCTGYPECKGIAEL
jgi:four helix bundle protein